MRILLMLAVCFTSLTSMGQDIQSSLRIQMTYEKQGQYIEQAIVSIEAFNKVGTATRVEYKAGQSVTLQPGFETQIGSTFVANIVPVGLSNEGERRLQLTVFPNPFEQSTTIEYYLPSGGKVNLQVVDVNGKVVGQLVQDENQESGNHRIEWSPKSLSAGVYIPIVEYNQQKAASRLLKK